MTKNGQIGKLHKQLAAAGVIFVQNVEKQNSY
jgi:hypothetical protein